MRIFIWLRKYRTTINGIFITIFTSLILNTISGTSGDVFKDPYRVFLQLVDFRSFSGVLTLASLILLVLFNVLLIWGINRINKKSFSREFPEFMKKYSSPQIADSLGGGCISWGEGKTVEICGDVIFGWTPENIVIDRYDDVMYSFFTKEYSERKFGQKSYHFNEEDYKAFKSTESFTKIINDGNNLPRVMLNKCSVNFDKHNRKLLLSVGRTEWSQTSYVWDGFGKAKGDEVDSNSLMKEYVSGIVSGDKADPYLPNSLCMHLLIESRDNKVVLAHISESKRNDNPGTWAATLGEQLDIEDIIDGKNYIDNFLSGWLKRAFKEEFKLDDKMFEDIVNESSLRCISVDFESDRYNFALLCTVKLRYSFDDFDEKVKVLISTDEANRLKGISIDEIPEILFAYADEERRKEYHPSTYLRLLMFYIHKYGYSKAEKELLKAEKAFT